MALSPHRELVDDLSSSLGLNGIELVRSLVIENT
jgi:hypothetical protein